MENYYFLDLKSGKILLSLKHKSMVSAITFSQDSKYIITASADKKLRIWNSQSGKHIRTLQGHKAGIRSLSTSSDGQFILSAGSDKTVKLWDLKNGIEQCELTGHSSAINEAVFHPKNNKIVVSTSNDKTIRILTSIISFVIINITSTGSFVF